MKKILLAPIFIFLGLTTSVIAQCPSFGTDQCTTAAPTVIGNSISCNPPLNNAGRNNFRVTNMIANATYRISNCGAGFDTQMTIRNLGGAVVGYNDDNGPACTGTAASIDFLPPATGDYRIQINRFSCQSSGFLETGDITVTLIADPPPPVTNDECSGATALTVNADLNCGVTTAGTTLGATASAQADDVTGTPNNDVWYSFIATDTAHVVSLLNVVLVNGSTDMGIGVYDGTSGCSALTFVDDSDPNTLNLTGLTIGNLYYVRVYGWFSTSSDAANFDICVGTDSPCVLPTPISTAACPTVDVTPDSATVGSCGSGSGPVDLTAAYTDLGDTSDYDVDLITWDPIAFSLLSAAASTNIALSADDRWSDLAYSIPFDFCFYGNSVTQFVVGANGAISFDSSLANTGSGYSFNNNLPSTTGALFENAIYGVYHDIDPSVAGTISYGTTSINGCNALVILWDDVAMFDNGNFGDNTKRNTSMIVMYENTNTIEVYIEEKVIDDDWNNNNAIVGLQNATATAAVVPPCRNALDTDWATTNELWRFTPSGGSSIATLQWLVDGTLDPTYNGQTTISVNPTSTTTYTAQVTYNLCNATTLVITDNVIVSTSGAKIWDGSQPNDNWMDPLNWSDDAIPTPADCVIIPNTGNDPVIYNGSHGDGLNLTIENGATLTQQANSTLTIVNFIDVETGGTYNMDDSSSLIQVDDVANTVDGTFTMSRNTNIRVNDYVYWSSPVTSFNVQNISPGTPNGYKYEWLPTLFQGIGPPGNMVFGEWQNYNTGIMDIGKGYIVKGPTGHTATPSNYTATFSGTPNNGTIVQPIERGTYTGINYTYQPIPGGDNLLVTSDDDNWNLIGNPYPSAINAIDFLTHTNNGNISGSVYLWTHGTDIGAANTDPFYEDYVYNYNVADYIAYNSSGTSTPTGFNGNIGAGQGFFVLMTDAATTNETVTFDNSMRSSAYANNQFYRTSNPSNMDGSTANRIWLDYVNPSGQTSTTLVAYIDGATNDEDRMYDAHTTTGNGLDLYSLIDEKEFLIQGRQLPFNVNDQVPLGLNITETGIHTIAVNTLQGLFNDSDQDIFIEDLLNDTTHNIKESPYSFTSESGIINNRFVLRFTNTTLGLEDLDTLSGIIVFEDNEKIILKSDYETIASINVYDVLGRILYFNKTVNANTFSIESISPNNTTLLIKITLTDGKQKIAKIIF